MEFRRVLFRSVIEPFPAVAEPPRQVLHQRQVQLDKLATDAQPVRIASRQGSPPPEQPAGASPVLPRMLNPRRGDRDLLVGGGLDLAGDPDVDFPGSLGIDMPGDADLDFLGHKDLDGSRLFLSSTVTLPPGPTHASTAPASADRTVQANVSRDGGWARWLSTDTAMVMLSSPRVKSQDRLAPGAAWLIRMPHASSTAMRRSSISSSVKSSRAARPAVAVRSTDRYAPSAGMRIVTRSSAAGSGGCPPWCAASGTPAAAGAVIFSITSALQCRLPSCVARGHHLPCHANYRPRGATLTQRPGS